MWSYIKGAFKWILSGLAKVWNAFIGLFTKAKHKTSPIDAETGIDTQTRISYDITIKQHRPGKQRIFFPNQSGMAYLIYSVLGFTPKPVFKSCTCPRHGALSVYLCDGSCYAQQQDKPLKLTDINSKAKNHRLQPEIKPVVYGPQPKPWDYGRDDSSLDRALSLEDDSDDDLEAARPEPTVNPMAKPVDPDAVWLAELHRKVKQKIAEEDEIRAQQKIIAEQKRQAAIELEQANKFHAKIDHADAVVVGLLRGQVDKCFEAADTATENVTHALDILKPLQPTMTNAYNNAAAALKQTDYNALFANASKSFSDIFAPADPQVLDECKKKAYKGAFSNSTTSWFLS